VADLLDTENPNTGPFWDRVADFSSAAVKLTQMKTELGLSVISGTTFGALSESELEFALKTALPTNLTGEPLRQWVADKISAQEKLATELERAAQMLAKPGTSVEDVIAAMTGNTSKTSQGGKSDTSKPVNWSDL